MQICPKNIRTLFYEAVYVFHHIFIPYLKTVYRQVESVTYNHCLSRTVDLTTEYEKCIVLLEQYDSSIVLTLEFLSQRKLLTL